MVDFIESQPGAGPASSSSTGVKPGHNPSICSGYRAVDPVFCRFLPGIDPRSTSIDPVKIKIFFVDPVITRTIVRFRPGACPVSPVSTRYRSGFGMSGSGFRGRGSGYMYISPYLYIFYTRLQPGQGQKNPNIFDFSWFLAGKQPTK